MRSPFWKTVTVGMVLLGILLASNLVRLPGPVEGGEETTAEEAAPLDLDKTGIDRNTYRPLLADLQGNILEDHGREHTILLFLEFKPNQAAARKWIREFATRQVTSALAQAKPGPFTGFYLSALGYVALGFNTPAQMPRDEVFFATMKDDSFRNCLGDPEVSKWDTAYQNRIDALILLADDKWKPLKKRAGEVKTSCQAIARIVGCEPISRLRNKQGHEIEHFGFIDSVTQPVFFTGKKKPAVKFDSCAPLSLALIRDPNGKQPNSCGSFLVVRKLHQHVPKFNKALKDLARKLGISTELAGAYVVGRFKDGTPVTLCKKPQGKKEIPQDFDYQGDRGQRCPLHCHIRKMNPRGSSKDSDERGHRIVRRSLMYGIEENGEVRKDGNIGMMFMCFQADLRKQFVFLQSNWANTQSFPENNSGLDPLIGQLAGLCPGSGQIKRIKEDRGGTYYRVWNDPNSKQTEVFAESVTMKGGEYFFAPSLSFLKTL